MMNSTAFKQDVFDVLNNAGATALRSAELGDGISVAQWFNQHGEAEYDQPGHHTFSVYLNGGEAVERLHKCGARLGGAPGKICLLPDDHRSKWRIPKSLEMFHLYFSSEKIKSMALKVFDRDPRQVGLLDLSFEADRYAEELVKHVVMPLNWSEKADRLALSSAADLFLVHILKNYSQAPQALPAVKGGLPTFVATQVEEYLNTHFAKAVGIEELAELAGYSSFHFARMFKESFALPPHKYLNNIRIERAKEYLKNADLTLAEVALACGFSSQAHFTSNFKKAVGVTPRQFRNP